MPRTGVGPVILTSVDDAFTESAKIEAIVWEGATTAGDTCQVKGRSTTQNVEFWKGRTATTHTYLGISFGTKGLSAPDGFRLSQLSAGRVLVYLKED